MSFFKNAILILVFIIKISFAHEFFEKENELKMKIARNLLSKVVSTKF